MVCLSLCPNRVFNAKKYDLNFYRGATFDVWQNKQEHRYASGRWARPLFKSVAGKQLLGFEKNEVQPGLEGSRIVLKLLGFLNPEVGGANFPDSVNNTTPSKSQLQPRNSPASSVSASLAHPPPDTP